MTRTTPPRPLDIEAVFPELRAHRGTTTRLHPRPGRPGVRDSSVGGPLRWPREEPWPVCPEAHGPRRGRRPADIHRARRVLAGAWSRDPAHGPTDEERRLLGALREEHRAESAPVPLVGLAQLYRRDVPDLLPGPGGRDLLQVLWCPFDAHGASGYEPFLDVRWRYSAGTGDADVRTDPPPTPQVVGHDGYVPEPCVPHPEQVTTYPFAGSLPAELRARLDAWDEENDAADEEDDGPRRPPTRTTSPSRPAGAPAASPPGTPRTRTR
ncbi:hypothetical protein ACQYWQ_08625 [Streptomyces sp. P6-2-1]|uniref:hypothetical protein n=1 Tax=Streptomyces sp. P6-2-1 TaxID=3422591 RepID=UPI003D36CB35